MLKFKVKENGTIFSLKEKEIAISLVL